MGAMKPSMHFRGHACALYLPWWAACFEIDSSLTGCAHAVISTAIVAIACAAYYSLVSLAAISAPTIVVFLWVIQS